MALNTTKRSISDETFFLIHQNGFFFFFFFRECCETFFFFLANKLIAIIIFQCERRSPTPKEISNIRTKLFFFFVILKSPQARQPR